MRPPLGPSWRRVCAAVVAGGVCATSLLGAVGVLPSGAPASYAATTMAFVDPDPRTPAELSPVLTRSTVPDLSVPADSGTGRRIVFDQGSQRVWLVLASGDVARTYAVSGSLYDNLDPGSYVVFSRSEQAWAYDGSGTMRWMVRFAHGPTSTIGFHSIPESDGVLAQTRAELGTPHSHGCIRQWVRDAKALWDFAPVGTPVVVV